MKPLTSLIILALLTVRIPAAPTDDADRAALIKGVNEIDTNGVPGGVCAFGPDAFAVVAGKEGAALLPIVAAARWNKGRIVAFGHDGFFRTPNERGNGALLVTQEIQRLRSARPEQLAANPASYSFPGMVPKTAPRIADRTLTINTAVPQWHTPDSMPRPARSSAFTSRPRSPARDSACASDATRTPCGISVNGNAFPKSPAGNH